MTSALSGAFADPPKQPPRRVLLNGSAIDDIRDVTLVDVRVVIRPDGTIELINPAYRVERRPGMVPQVVRRSLMPINKPVFVVAEVQTATGKRPPFAVELIIGSQTVVTVHGSDARETHDISQHLTTGPNGIRFRAIEQYVPGGTDPAAQVTLTIGYGTRTGKLLAIDRVLTTWTWKATDGTHAVVDRTLNLDTGTP